MKPHTYTNRSLCECELYSPANYDNDPEMKEVMQQFVDRTTQRFQEYDERMKTTRQKCKEQCDKEIQKIILKDKLEKQMEQQLNTLETKIDTDDIPTCVCEKTMADKTEKFCLNCGVQLGGGVLQASGLLGGIGAVAVNAWKNTALKAAIVAAQKAGDAAGVAAGEAAGMEFVIKALKHFGVENFFPGICDTISSTGHYTKVTEFVNTIYSQYNWTCNLMRSPINSTACNTIEIALNIRTGGSATQGPPAQHAIRELLKVLAYKAELNADDVTKTTTKEVTKAAIETSTGAIDAASTHLYSTIAYSITAILIIVLIMVIIYLILRYRRKKKMKKKLQYIKLLEE